MLLVWEALWRQELRLRIWFWPAASKTLQSDLLNTDVAKPMYLLVCMSSLPPTERALWHIVDEAFRICVGLCCVLWDWCNDFLSCSQFDSFQSARMLFCNFADREVVENCPSCLNRATCCQHCLSSAGSRTADACAVSCHGQFQRMRRVYRLHSKCILLISISCIWS